MKRQFDLVVIGTGAAGSAPAHKCRAAGWQVAVIDELPYGGTCALRGCDPKKVLVGAGELTEWSRRMQAHGVSGDLQIRWLALIQFKQTFTEPVPAQREESFKAKGIETFHGPAKFVDGTTLQVGDSFLTGRYVHIAAGAKPAQLKDSRRGPANDKHAIPWICRISPGEFCLSAAGTFPLSSLTLPPVPEPRLAFCTEVLPL
jgi:glutathione reductase (NADPH)